MGVSCAPSVTILQQDNRSSYFVAGGLAHTRPLITTVAHRGIRPTAERAVIIEVEKQYSAHPGDILVIHGRGHPSCGV